MSRHACAWLSAKAPSRVRSTRRPRTNHSSASPSSASTCFTCTRRKGDSDLDTKGLWDRERLAQVVTNLIGNAIQHGRLDGSIDVRLRDEGDAVCLLVHNDGSPIPADLLPSIFDPFRRGRRRATQKAEGLGLGLFIVREMVRAHSGEISVQSTEAEGTTFTVKLPRRSLDF